MNDSVEATNRDDLPGLPRRRAIVALTAGLIAVCATVADVSAQSRDRMDPGERERLRRELRQHDERRRGGDDARRGGDERAAREREARNREARDRDSRDRNRLSPPEREELRRQLREQRPEGRRARGRH